MLYAASAQIHHVPQEYASIQTAIDIAQNGDTVLVQPGTYNEHLFLTNKNLTIASMFLLTNNDMYIDNTILDGGNILGSVIKIDNQPENDPSLICGFTIQHGKGIIVDGTLRGGGIFCSGHVKIRENIIRNNGNLELTIVTISAYGAGIYCSGGYSVEITDNKILNNGYNIMDSELQGGGIWVDNATISGNIIDCNELLGVNDSWGACNGAGGGIYCENGIGYLSDNTITNNTIKVHCNDNPYGATAKGGGFYGNFLAENNIVTNNEAFSYAFDDEYANAIAEGGGGYGEELNSINNLVALNRTNASAISWHGDIYSSSKYGGLFANSVRNSTITENICSGGQILDYGGVYANSGYNNIAFDNYPNNGGTNFKYSWYSDPYFVSGGRGDYYLSQINAGQSLQSPGVDAGNPLSPLILGITRNDELPDTGIVDLGFHYSMDYWKVSAGFSLDTNQLCINNSVCFTDNSNGIITSWLWSFPGGLPSSSILANPVITYPVTGDFNVELKVSNQFFADSIIIKNLISVNTVPLIAPPLPQGPAELCNNPTDTIYTTLGSSGIDDYLWELIPAEAGVIQSNGTIASVSWNEDYSGYANIRVAGQNMCGTGSWSEELVIEICLGTGELNAPPFFAIRPNPNVGKFDIKVNNALNQRIIIRFIDPLGNIVLKQERFINPDVHEIKFDFLDIKGGIYFIEISGDTFIFTDKIMISK